MAKEVVEKKLYNAASKGDLTTLKQLVQEDPYLVHEAPFACSRNLLHVAAMHGQSAIVEEVLRMNPRLARIPDSQKSSPLHIAAAEGHVIIASKLLSVAPEMCWWRDDQGMNPVHVASMNGHVEIVEHLVQESCLPAMERLHRGQTVLHLCVKHGQFRALKVLVENLGELVCAKDDDGETLLHLAVRCNQVETIQYLVDNKTVERQTRNSMGKTALQVLNESPPHTATYTKIKRILKNLSNESYFHVIPKMTDVTMVVVVLIATMAFQAALNPPGGVNDHGEAVLAHNHPKVYRSLIRSNSTAFISSLLTIFLITTGLPSTNFFFMAVAMYATWVSLTAIMISYGTSQDIISPNSKRQTIGHVIMIVVAVVLNFFGLTTAYVVISKLYVSWKEKKRQQHDLTTDHFVRRLFYWIFQQLERRGFLSG
ncbi:ankyrin repeat-containing protein ITN1-like [Salvia miltiorrhiza]|uniref:ankyrin repeat-containing protein ITN1-like n=1 Tax=Salvia miltiorrhiza TaxID=226208 RepID=UPI0025ACA201|nr:ankyrin repeat-containing protein ITN1-like [Salvia miltiorrhiza]